MKSSVNFIDLTGKVFSMLTVLKRDENSVKTVYWFCQCKCGNIKRVRGSHLKAGKIKSCGCLLNRPSSHFKDLTGKSFGYLTVLEVASRGCKPQWKVRCKCGKEFIADGARLKSGHTRSCGCYYTETHTKHNLTVTNKRLYSIFISMKDRCYNANNSHYKYYGGRGITICKAWMKSNISFFNWALKHGYQDDLTIDRIRVNGNYTPQNCRFATRKEQMINRRCCIGDEVALKIKTELKNGAKMKELVKKYKISYDSVLDIKNNKIYTHVLI